MNVFACHYVRMYSSVDVYIDVCLSVCVCVESERENRISIHFFDSISSINKLNNHIILKSMKKLSTLKFEC